MTALPEPVEQYRAFALRDGPRRIETVEIESDAWMRRPGMPRIPLRLTMSHRLGHEFVHDIRIGRGMLSFRFGVDAYVAGCGLMKVGRSVESGPHFDQGALIALWAEILCFPSSWDGREDVGWEAVDATTARLVVRGPEGDLPITVVFDRGSGCPAYCEAERYKAAGPKVLWRGTWSDWRRWPGGVLAPARMSARWADEPYPWLVLRARSVGVNVPVGNAFGLADRARAGAPALSRR